MVKLTIFIINRQTTVDWQTDYINRLDRLDRLNRLDRQIGRLNKLDRQIDKH